MVRINNMLRIFMVLCLLGGFQLTTACSIINYNKGYKPDPQEGWTELPSKGQAYRYEYKCNSFSVFVRSAIFTKLSGYWGSPIIPIPVIPFSKKYDSLLFEINVEKNADVTLPDEPLNIELRMPSTEQVLVPVKSGKRTVDTNMIREWGVGVYYDYIDSRTGRTFLYKFDLISKEIKEFEIIFASETLGCSIPKLTFKTKSKIVYNPIKIPWR